MRPVFFAFEQYPRYVGTERGDIPAYLPVGNQSVFQAIGHIPEVPHTYGYHEETYGALNEHQLGIGETTCSGVFGTKPIGQGGKAMMSVDTMTQLAMERTNTSRAAVALMGAMAEKYGFYGAGSFEGSAESLMVTDPNEGWIFHVLPDDTGTSAIWAAQRVPDDHVAVVPNVFVIREVNFSDTYNFQGSASVHSVAQKKGWWKPSDGLIDFTSVYSDGEYAHKFYSGRRAWAAYHMLAPSLGLQPDYVEWRKSRPYPVTVAPDKKVSLSDIASVMRSYYEGTDFDATVGKRSSAVAAGPWQTPDHVMGGSADGKAPGNWERTIGLWRTSDSIIVQSRSWLPDATGGVLWWGPHAAPYTLYVPFSAGVTKLPDVTLGHPAKHDRSSLFWAVRYMFNYAQMRRNVIIKDINALQQETMAAGLATIEALTGTTPAAVLNTAFATNAEAATKAAFELVEATFFKYADGFISTFDEASGTVDVTMPSYPNWWLNAVGYANGPPPVPSKKMVWV
jgi:dipeptidase